MYTRCMYVFYSPPYPSYPTVPRPLPTKNEKSQRLKESFLCRVRCAYSDNSPPSFPLFFPVFSMSCFKYIPVITAYPVPSSPSPCAAPKSPTHRPPKTAFIPSPLSSSITNPLPLRTPSTAATTFSKLLLAPFSCVKRAILRFAFLPRWRTVKSSIAKERGGMCRAEGVDGG